MKEILGLAALVLLAGARCQHDVAAQPAAPAPTANEVWVTPKQIQEAGIVTTEVAERPVGNLLRVTGRVTFTDARVVHVFSPVTGRVSRLMAEIGQAVRRGEALATIQSPELAAAISDEEKAEADLAAARRDYERQQELYEAHAAAARDFEAAESSYRKARAERDRAVQKCDLLGVRGATSSPGYVLRAPIDGNVLGRIATGGMEVQGQYSGGNAAELFTIGNLDSVWVLADIFEVDLPRVRIGAPVSVNVVSYPDHPFVGTVDWISGSLDPATRTVKVRCTIPNREHLLLPEMYATVSMATDRKPRLAVPRSAVVRLGDSTVAFVDRGSSPAGGERFERRAIVIDENDDGPEVPVFAGLRAGEKVVSSGAVILSESGQ